jgi:hypothetical protein
MIDWKSVAVKAGIVLAAVFATGSLVGVVAKHFYDQKLATAEANATAANATAARQVKAAHDSLAVAAKSARRAQKMIDRAPIEFDSVAKLAPDTCAFVVAAGDIALQAAKDAFDVQKQATASLQTALTATADTLQETRNASDKLVTVIKHPSFLARLKPSITLTVGPQVGVNTHGNAYGGAGATFGLSWKL